MSKHIPILLTETIANLNLKAGDVVVDCTTNRGGHALEIAKVIGKSGVLICLDLDNQALSEAKVNLERNIFKNNLPKIYFINDNFRNIIKILENLKIKEINGLLADLGVSSQELDISGRGFTFQKDEPLLMTLKDKLDKDDLTAEKIINNWEEDNIADIIYYYGDERYAKRIAKHIIEARKIKPIKSTSQLVEVIKDSVPVNYQKGKIHFATRTFQALRIAVNDELRSEEELIKSLPRILKSESRAAFLTFHSGEDRVLKRVVKEYKKELKLVKFSNNKDFLEPSREEIKNNPRSRSSKLRLIQKYSS